MIEAGDRVMVCLSGGKDSYTLLDILLSLQRSAPVDFELIAVNLDQKQPGFPAHVLPDYLTALGVPFHVIEQDTYSVVKRVIPEGKTMCGLCSRLRRGALYRYAGENGITKIALGHHRDDIVETLFLNMFFGGKLKAMPPKLRSEDGRHIVIRPLAYVAEREIERYARARRISADSVHAVRLAGQHAARGDQEDAARMGAAATRAAPSRSSPACATSSPSHLADPRAVDFVAIRQTGEIDVRMSGAAYIVFSHGQDGEPWGAKIVAMAEVARAHGLSVESVDYRGMDDPAVRVRRLLEVCKDAAGQPGARGLEPRRACLHDRGRRRCRCAACSCWRRRSSCPDTSSTRRAAGGLSDRRSCMAGTTRSCRPRTACATPGSIARRCTSSIRITA